MKKLFVFLGIVFTAVCSVVRAQEVTDYIPDIYLDTRVGYDQFFYDGTGRFGATGLYLDINGKISPGLTYRFNHILAGPYFPEEPQGFDATQWLNFTYHTGNFSFTAGKLSSNIGNFEYDADVLDAYFDMNSMFYNMVDCYQWGLAADWNLAENHVIQFQFTNSPLSSGPNQYGYNLDWRGEMGFFESYWSTNLWQCAPDRYMKGLNFGNRFYLGNFTVDLEYMARAVDMSDMFKKDFNIIAAPAYQIGEWCRLFGKFGFESTADDLIYNLAYDEYKGSDYLYYGAGVEIFPFKEDRSVRLHAFWSSNNHGDSLMNIGLRWKLDLTSSVKSLLNRVCEN